MEIVTVLTSSTDPIAQLLEIGNTGASGNYSDLVVLV